MTMATDPTCTQCARPVDGYDSSGRGLCQDCDQQRRYDEDSEPEDSDERPSAENTIAHIVNVVQDWGFGDMSSEKAIQAISKILRQHSGEEE